mmetsp:Transcript_56961/g.101706  ORF Transcript_56961/g.101706 Transcript_56961/m.101706 type:complete len:102 (+) Transcript_56961:1500-1805(+)
MAACGSVQWHRMCKTLALYPESRQPLRAAEFTYMQSHSLHSEVSIELLASWSFAHCCPLSDVDGRHNLNTTERQKTVKHPEDRGNTMPYIHQDQNPVQQPA